MSPWIPFLFLFFLAFSATSQATVPASGQFRFVNEGEFGDYVVEYRANYRILNVFNNPFQLCFYNTTPSAYTLALRMGTVRTEALMRWVWEANRGSPVGERATFSLGADGNLVLAEANGKIVWQTGTANKGVVGFRLLSNGNMVLHDSRGRYVWQSFDYPTDTLLVGQSLRAGGRTKLVSRASARTNRDGPYSFVLEPKRLALYYTSRSSPKPRLLFTSSNWFTVGSGTLDRVTFNSIRARGPTASYLLLAYQTVGGSTTGSHILASPTYNATLSYLRLGFDGNLRSFTYSENGEPRVWLETFTLFRRNSTLSG